MQTDEERRTAGRREAPGGSAPTRRRLALAGMALGLAVAALDQMILATAATAISAELGGLGRVSWIFAGYLLASACTMPLWGRLGDLYGRRRVFQVAIGLFIVASLLAGSAPDLELLVVARCLQGLGGGGLFALPNAIVADLVEPRLRASYYAINTSVWAVTGLLGPLIGGLLVDWLGWRFVFFINVPVGLVAIACMAAGHRVPHQRVAHAVDAPGALLLATSVGALLLLVSDAASGWALRIGLGILSLVAGLAFVAQERRSPEPLVPLSLLEIPTLRTSLGVMVLYGLANFAVAVFVPLFAITVAGTSATEAGLRLLPVPIGLLTGSVVVGRLIARGVPHRRFPALGLGLHAAALVLFSTLQADTPRAVGLVYGFLAGLGAGFVNPVITYALQLAVPPARLGLATALPTFTRISAQSVGIALLGAVLAARLGAHLALLLPEGAPDITPDALQARAEDLRALGEPLAGLVVEACRRALSEVFLVMAALMGGAMLVSLGLSAGDGRRP